jgi:hypothetical protein
MAKVAVLRECRHGRSERPVSSLRLSRTTSRQRRITAPLEPTLRIGGMIPQSVGFADLSFSTGCTWRIPGQFSFARFARQQEDDQPE